MQYGRVTYADLHVFTDLPFATTGFPAECGPAPYGPNQQIAEFVLFDGATCPP